MNRTVPRATSDEIQLYRSTLYSLLRSTAEVKIKTLEGVHAGMNSLMHPGAHETTPDTSAFIYSAMRLPDCILDTRLVILGQNATVFQQGGYPNIEEWHPVSAKARRRRCSSRIASASSTAIRSAMPVAGSPAPDGSPGGRFMTNR